MNSFFVPGPGPYLLTHSVGCLPHAARDALVTGFVRPWQERGGNAWPEWLRQIDGFRGALADLLGGEAREYCPQANLSSGLVKFLQAMPRAKASRNVLLAAEDSFPSLGFVLREAERLGYALRLVPRSESPDDVASWSRRLDRDVCLALATHVHSNSGRIAPVAQIAQLCRERDILCVIDVAQSAGILPLDVAALSADLVLGSCIKWLCGGPGAGYLWIRPTLIERLEPLDVGWFSHADPFEMDIHSFEYAGDARRFWGGTPSVAPFVMAAASLAHLRTVGVEAVRAHNQRLVQVLRDALPASWRARLPSWPSGGTLCIALGGDFDVVIRALQSIGAQFDSRGDVVRLSFHLCNSDEDALLVARAFGDR